MRRFKYFLWSDLTIQEGDAIYTPLQLNDDDSDLDNIPDIVERYGLKPNGQYIGTDPYLKDTDGDGLDDNEELHYFTNKLVYPLTLDQTRIMFSPASDPTKSDSDGDGLLDGKAQYVGSKKVAPRDPNPMKTDGPNGAWLEHINSVKTTAVPTTLNAWYGDTNPDLENSGTEGFDALDEEIDYILTVKAIELNSTKFKENIGVAKWAISAGQFTVAYAFFNAALNEIDKCVPDAEEAGEIKANLGSRFLNFKADSNEVLHSQYNTWQAIGGYNNAYDTIFSTFTNGNMRREKFAFTVGNMEYVLWIWRGDYLNLGAGGEMGIYSRSSGMSQSSDGLDHYFVDKSLSMPMKLYLYDYNSSTDIENIFSWDPTDPQWWVTGFNPEYVGNVDAASEVMIGCVDFSQFTNSEGDNEMYEAIKDQTISKLKKYVIFDEDDKKVWLCWYEG